MNRFTLRANVSSGAQLRWLCFEEVPERYSEPGQFVTAHVHGHQAHFAIASMPGEPLELLVKDAGDAGRALCASPIGARFDIAGPAGKGFLAAATRPLPLVCLVNGSALSAVRPVIETEVRAGLPRSVILLLGVLTENHIPFSSDIARWRDAGVEIHIVLDQPTEGWTGHTGYVQDVAVQRGLVTKTTAVVACGFPAMQKQAASVYAEAGHDPAHFLTNY